MSKFDEAMALLSECAKEGTRISSPATVFPLLRTWITKKEENFIVIYLDGKHAVQGKPVSVFKGTLNRTIAHPREIFAIALRKRSCAIIVAHNHPSGDSSPSPEDLDVTKQLIESGAILGIPVLDHLIITKSGYYSMCEHGIIDFSGKSE